MRILVLDNEAVGALRDPRHRHHRQAMAFLEAHRPVRRADKGRRTVVPTAVRVEAGWDRTAPASAFINRLNIIDISLDKTAADHAATLLTQQSVSIADAHVGAVIYEARGHDVSVLTSDPDDVRAVAGTEPVDILTL